MSKAEFKRFSNIIHHDDNLQIRVKQTNNPSELIQMGKEKGFDFTFEDIAEGLRELNDCKEKRHEFLKNTPRAILSFDEANINEAGVLGLDYFSEDILNLAK